MIGRLQKFWEILFEAFLTYFALTSRINLVEDPSNLPHVLCMLLNVGSEIDNASVEEAVPFKGDNSLSNLFLLLIRGHRLDK